LLIYFEPILAAFKADYQSRFHFILLRLAQKYVGLGQFGFFQFRFDSVRFSISSTWFRFFFGFGIRTPLQCKSILVCENTNVDSINFHKKFQLKYINRPCGVWRSYSSHSVCGHLLHTLCGRSVCWCVTVVSPSIMAQLIDMPFGLRTRMGPRNDVCYFRFQYSHITATQEYVWVLSSVT